jgi:hypothetical protein
LQVQQKHQLPTCGRWKWLAREKTSQQYEIVWPLLETLLARAVVSSKVGWTKRCRDRTAVKIQARNRRRFCCGMGQPADPSRIDLQLVTGLAIEDRDRRRRLPKLQLQDREAVQGRIRDQHALPREQLANLREPHPITKLASDRRALLDTAGPSIAARPTAGGMQREQDLLDVFLTDGSGGPEDACGFGDGEIPPHGLGIETELRSDALLGQALAS